MKKPALKNLASKHQDLKSLESQQQEHIDIFLQPGEFYFGDQNTRLRTILGSCVSMTFWHPHRLLGGMSHIMLPMRPVYKNRVKVPALDAKYADEAIILLLAEMKAAATSPHEYQVKLFGGGDMFPETSKQQKSTHLGLKNIEATKSLLKQHGFTCQAEHLGGMGHRYIMFDVWNGDVWVKHMPKE